MASLQSRLESGASTLGLDLPPSAVQQLLDYLALLAKWNRAYNLTAVREPEQMVTRHLLDSLAVLPYLDGDRFADVGTGAGLPGIPLAIVRPDAVFDLFDSNGKKIRFVTQAIRELRLTNISAHRQRVESVRPELGYDAVLSRAFAAVADMVSWCGHLPKPQGRLLAMKGLYPAEELAALPAGYTVAACHRLTVPGAAAERHLLVLQRDPQRSGLPDGCVAQR